MSEVKNIGIPVVVTRDSDGTIHSQDIYSRLLKDRIVMIDGEIEPRMASVVVAQLLFLQSEDAEAPINIYISSPGGMVTAGLSIIDTMNLVKPPVHVVAHGSIASMASVITSCGEKGHRMLLPNTRVMLHQASAGTQGNIQDMRVTLKETERINSLLVKMLAEQCGKTEEEMLSFTQRDFWLDANEAVKFGIADGILVK